jgi:hypothetical protein
MTAHFACVTEGSKLPVVRDPSSCCQASNKGQENAGLLFASLLAKFWDISRTLACTIVRSKAVLETHADESSLDNRTRLPDTADQPNVLEKSPRRASIGCCPIVLVCCMFNNACAFALLRHYLNVAGHQRASVPIAKAGELNRRAGEILGRIIPPTLCHLKGRLT